jgi:hypothetical protein
MRRALICCFFPKYSPELNPCELVFAQMKAYIRGYRSTSFSLVELMLDSLIRIEYKTLFRYYERCTSIFYRYILPEREAREEEGEYSSDSDESDLDLFEGYSTDESEEQSDSDESDLDLYGGSSTDKSEREGESQDDTDEASDEEEQINIGL